MGKATILGSGDRNLARGRYRVRIEKSDERALNQAKILSKEIQFLDTTISERSQAYDNAQRAHQRAESDLNAIVRQRVESPGENPGSKVNSAVSAERSAYSALLSAKSQYQTAVLKQKSLEKQRDYLNNLVTEDIRTVWCADCTRNLTGSVGTLEIPNTDDTILIHPGGADGEDSEYSESRDGQLRSVASMSPAEAAYNYTLFPGWQKWKPLYRLGTITQHIKNNSKCSVLLDAYSTAQGLATDVTRTLTNVPMVYKNRDDGGPYEIGDRVVVGFYGQNWEAPRVIGFEDNPCTTSSSSTTTSAPPDVPGIFQISYIGGDLYKFAGWSNTLLETESNSIGGRWRGCCRGPGENMIAAEQHSHFNLYQFSGISTIVDSVIGDISALPISGLYYDETTTNLVSIHGGTLRVHNGVSTAISSTLTFPYADSLTGFVSLDGACSFLGDLVMSVHWYSIAESKYKAQLWRMVGYSSTLSSVLADYTAYWNSVLAHPFVYSSGFAFHIFGLNKMIKYEVSPPGPGLVINDFSPGWPGTQFVGGGYAEYA